MRKMMKALAEANRAMETFTEEQKELARECLKEIYKCWDIDMFDEDAVYKASFEEIDVKFDYMIEAIEDEIVSSKEEFEKILEAVRTVEFNCFAFI